LIRQLLQTSEVSFLQDQVLMKPAFHGSQVSWHQDSGYWNNIEPWIDPPAIVTCWVAIDNVTEDNGCVRMVPGSHKYGVLEHRRGGDNFLHVQGVDLDAAQPVVLPPGGVSFHHSCTVHGSAPNRSPNRRRGLALTYVRDDARRLDQP
jgi:phytanoyl-CoA hydroxylase